MISLLIMLVAVWVISKRVSKRLWKIHAAIEENSKDAHQDLAIELHAMQVVLNRFPECKIPTSRWSMRFVNLHVIVDILDRIKPDVVVEFGSGISTLCIASWMRQQGRGHLYSFDHDEDWASLTKRHVTSNQLEDFVTLNFAELAREGSIAKFPGWYQLGTAIDEIDGIDLVVVDGPPAGLKGLELSRLPALPALQSRLSAHAVLVLDDARRNGESTVVERWKNQFPEFNSRVLGETTGIAVLERGGR
ncbi:class I SAM-dependent methyltransferase [Planctomycetaceae bacterium SH139]